MSGVAYIRLFGDDWLSGTAELDLEERGALITIVALTSTTGSPPTCDFKRLSKRFGCTPRKAQKVVANLVAMGKIQIVDDTILNKRAQKETVFSQKTSEKQSEKAQQRWVKNDGKSNVIKGRADATALLRDMQRECQPEPEPEPLTPKPPLQGGDDYSKKRIGNG